MGEGTTMPKIEVIVKIDDEAVSKMSQIGDQCKAAGMSVEQQMSAVGMISGSIEKANIGKIEQIKGVSYVEASKAI